MVVYLNPLKMNVPEHRMLLKALFNSNLVQVKWIQNQSYPITDATGVTLEIKLTHDVLPINREGSLYYRVISNTLLGEGASGKVYPVECLLQFPNGDNYIEYIEPQLVVKIVNYKLSGDIVQQKAMMRSRVEREWAYSNSLGMEPIIEYYRQPDANEALVFGLESEYIDVHMVMNRVPGRELFSILLPSYYELNDPHQYPLSSHMRFFITWAVLYAFKEQLVDENIMHGDIKVENIMLDTGLTQRDFEYYMREKQGYVECDMLATIIDFATAREYGQVIPPFAKLGTPFCVAPEVDAGIIANQQADIYALGVVIRKIWALGTYDFHNAGTYDIHNQKDVDARYDYFLDKDDFTVEQFRAIHYLTLKMMAPDPSHRGSVETIMESFQSIFTPPVEVLAQENLAIANEQIHSHREVSPVSVFQMAKAWSYPHNNSSANPRSTPCFFKSSISSNLDKMGEISDIKIDSLNDLTFWRSISCDSRLQTPVPSPVPHGIING